MASTVIQLKSKVTQNVTQQNPADRITGVEVREVLNLYADEFLNRGIPQVADVTALNAASGANTLFVYVDSFKDFFKYQAVGVVDDITYFSEATGGVWVRQFVGGTGVLYVSSYDELRSAETDHEVAVVFHDRYGGTFKKVVAGSENGGTIIEGANGNIWKRMFDGKTFRPEWWEIGGKDHNGNSYDRLIGEGVGTEADAIVSCVRVGGEGAIIQYMPPEEKEYIIDRYIPIIQNQVHRGPATIKRANPIQSVLTADAPAGSFSFEVADASQFRAGQAVLVKDQGTDGSYGETSSGVFDADIYLISSIVGNVLNIDNTIGSNDSNKSMVIGDVIFTTVEMFLREDGLLGSNPENLISFFEYITLDGNKSANNLKTTYHYNSAIAMFGGHVTIKNCRFINSPAENIYCAGGLIEDSSYEDLNGGFVHMTSLQTTMDDIYRTLIVRNCFGKNSNLTSNVLSGHTEGVVTSSVNSCFVELDGCRFEDGGECIAGNFVEDERGLKINNCTFRNFRYGISIVNINNTTYPNLRRNYDILNSNFFNAGTIQVLGQNGMSANDGGRFINIVGNTFVNTRIGIGEAAYVNIESNRFLFNLNNEFTGFDNSNFLFSGFGAALGINATSERVNILNNHFSGFTGNAAFDANASTGIILILANYARASTGGVYTNYYFAQDYKIHGNTIENFRYAQGLEAPFPMVYQTVGWSFVNNSIYMTKNTSGVGVAAGGLDIPAGAIAKNNTVYITQNEALHIPLRGRGVDVAKADALYGAILMGNQVLGPSSAPIVATDYNVIVKDNIYNFGAITAGANTYQDGNVKLPIVFPAYINPVADKYRNVGEDF